jgi:glycosyltransferase involved in cell wall biosynthesis
MIYAILILAVVILVYICSMLWVVVGFASHRKNKYLEEQINAKHISVIIPVRNEEDAILDCLKSIEKQSYNKENYEILVIDDNSTDNTFQIVKEFIENTSVDINLFKLNEAETKKEALKLGLEKARFPIIVTTDGDCVYQKDWLTAIGGEIEGDDMLIGPVMFRSSTGLLNNFQVLDMLAMQGLGFGSLQNGKPILNNAANLAYSYSAYNDVGGYDSLNTVSGDDVFLLERFSRYRLRIKGILTESSIVETEGEKSLRSFLNQRVRWVSKSKYYKNPTLVFFSVIGLITNLLAIFIYFAVPFVEKYWVSLIILLLSKWVIDFILLLLVASFYKKKKALYYFIPVQLIYPFYILLVWIGSLTVEYKWKDRNYNG